MQKRFRERKSSVVSIYFVQTFLGMTYFVQYEFLCNLRTVELGYNEYTVIANILS